MNIPEGLLPSLLLPEVYGPWKFDRGFVARQIEQAAADGFYRSVEFLGCGDEAVVDAKARERVSDAGRVARLVVDHCDGHG